MLVKNRQLVVSLNRNAHYPVTTILLLCWWIPNCAFAVLGIFIKRGFNLVQWDHWGSRIFRAGRFIHAQKVCDEMHVLGFSPDFQTYCIVLDGFCKNAHVEEAEFGVPSRASIMDFHCSKEGCTYIFAAADKSTFSWIDSTQHDQEMKTQRLEVVVF